MSMTAHDPLHPDRSRRDPGARPGRALAKEIIASQAPWLIEPLLSPVSLHPDWNTVLVKRVRDAGEEYTGRDWAFRLDVVDAQGAPLRGLLYRCPVPKPTTG